MKRTVLFWLMLDFILAAIVAILGNVVASLLQEQFGLTEPGRAAFVFALFAAALNLSLFVTLKRYGAEALDGEGLERLLARLIPDSIERERAVRNRQAMLQLVRNTWIKGVLEQSLHGAAMIELGMEEKADAVERPWDMIVQMPGQPNRIWPKGTSIIDVFDEMNQCLLLLGEPGAGKTTMLLDLARDAIDRAERDPTEPIPVVFNLSSWGAKKGPINEWLVDELRSKYFVGKKDASAWVNNNELLLFLDGLDEVRAELRNDCVAALNAFRKHAIPMVACSRMADYAALTSRLNFSGAIVLQPLSAPQVEQYLEGTGVEVLAVRQALEHDSVLAELARTPMMLSIMTRAYCGLPARSINVASTFEQTRRHVFAAYVDAMFRRRGADKPWIPEATLRWLSWLAQRMIEHEQTVFLIERIQPNWVESRRQVRQYRTVVVATQTLLGALVFGLAGWLGLKPFSGPIDPGRISSTIRAVTVCGLVAGLGIAGPELILGPVRIQTVDALDWSWKAARRELRKSIIFMVMSFVLVLVGGMVTLSVLDRLDGETAVALIVGLILAQYFALLMALAGGLTGKPVETTTAPNQGITRSATHAVVTGVSAGLLTGLPSGLIATLFDGLDAGLFFALFIGLYGWWYGWIFWGGITVVRHIALRSVLTLTGHMPWRYARFLDYAAERIFLRKVGGGYIFVHRLLMEYFASLWTEEARPVTTNGRKH